MKLCICERFVMPPSNYSVYINNNCCKGNNNESHQFCD